MKRIISIFLLLIIFINLSSCKKFTEIPPPDTSLTTSAVFADNATAIAAIDGMYSTAASSIDFLSGDWGITCLTGLSADEFDNYFDDGHIDFYRNQVLPDNTIVSSVWSTPYNYIYTANAILEALNKSTGVSAEVKNQLAGEAKFLRAYYYFHLINYFGDVPLLLSTDYRVNAVEGKTSQAKVYEQIVKDLVEAQSLLVDDYPTGERVRANKQVATAFLSRIYLYTSEWARAEEQASLVIDDGRYVMATDLANAFLSGSQEAIWQLRPSIPQYATFDAGTLYVYPSSGSTTVTLSTEQINSFESGDQRLAKWVLPVDYDGTTYQQVYKYHQRYTDAPEIAPDEYLVMLRLSEQYLIRAEARLKQGKLTGANSAESDINEIRSRAGLLNTTATTEQDLFSAIMRERRSELFAEMGHRWFDLKRWNLADPVLAPVKPEWDPTHVFFPIPARELSSNSKLTQNLGY